jgi:hypothetical protein
MTRCAVWVVLCFVLFLSGVGAAHAQTPGTVPVWVDSQTLGDSPVSQCGDGTSVCVGPGTSAVTGQPAVLGFTGSTDLNATGVYGEASAPNGTTLGMFGVTRSVDDLATGVIGWATDSSAAAGVTTGVWGRSSSPRGRGVVGEGLTGVFGTGMYGVYGDSSVVGVYGRSLTGGVGVYGRSLTGYAGFFDGSVGITVLGAGSSQLCHNGSLLTECSSSLRYKSDVHSFSGGLDIVKRLRPIAFTWKAGGAHDVGLAAEEVEQVEPLLTFRNQKGEIEGVKYNQLSAVFVNAILDQQAQIERQQEEIKLQRESLAGLKAVVCQSHPDADLCW